MCNKEVKIIRPAKKLSAEEIQELNRAFDEAQAWAKSVGLTEKDIEDAIREVRQEKRARRQSA